MTNSFAILIRLIEPCIFSRHSASAGGHESLDYVPGAALLGSAAGALYSSLSTEEAFYAFHSGHVSYGDGMPISPSGQISWPTPKSWHVPKGHSIHSGNAAYPLSVSDFAGPNTYHGQFEQARTGFVSAGLEVVKPARQKTLKSAVDEVTGRSAEAQLFSYEAISASQTFVSAIQYDDKAQSFIEKIKQHFSDRYLRLGRSRSAEFGKVRVSILQSPPASPKRLEPAGSTLSVWAVSDLALTDENHIPTLIPSGGQFGWPSAEIVWERTFLRDHSYTPYNAHLKMPVTDRIVIQAGSIITFKFKTKEEAVAAFKSAPSSVGLYTEAGLGRVICGSAIVGAAAPLAPETSTPAVISIKTTSSPVQSKPPEIIEWALARVEQFGHREAALNRALALVKEIEARYTAAHSFSGTPAHMPVGPSPTQWLQVCEVLKQISLRADDTRQSALDKDLFGTSGIARSNDDKWKVKTGPNVTDTFSEWLKQQLKSHDDATLLALHEAATMTAAKLRTSTALLSDRRDEKQ